MKPSTGFRRAHLAWGRRPLALLLAVGAFGASFLVAGGSASAATSRAFSGIGVDSAGDGYAVVATSGENYDFGGVASHGNPTNFTGSIVSVAVTADGQGYAEVTSAGQVYTYGTVQYRGNPTGFSGSIVGISVTANGQGYAVVSSAGQNYDYGTVVSRGNPSGFTGSIVGVSVTADGQGYANVSSAGQNYDYGTVVSRGNPSGFTGSIVGVSVTADGQGYANVSSAGQNYDYGTVVSRGNPSGFTGSIAGVSVSANGQGYADVSTAGQVYAYGTVKYWGNGDPGTSSPTDLRSRIVSNARAQASNATNNKENPAGSNCNYFSTAVGAGSHSYSSGGTTKTCPNNWRAEAWCADFARWVWGQSGARTAGLTSGAISFKSYPGWHATNSLAGVQVGDVLGWNFGTSSTGDDHVSVVVAVNSNGTVSTVDGNYSDAVTSRTGVKASNSGETLSGYVSPTA